MSNEPKHNELSGADIVVKTLEQQGVKWIFGIPGAKIDKVFDTLVDSSIQTVVCRHEQNAAFIAGGIGRMTGKAGVTIATSGPGVSNLVTGLATANTEGDPVIGLGGAVPLADRLKKIHQSMDNVNLCRPVTKFSAEVDSPESVSEVLINAFRSAESGGGGGIIRINHIRPILPQVGSLPRSINCDNKIHSPGRLKKRPQRNRLTTFRPIHQDKIRLQQHRIIIPTERVRIYSI